MAKTIALLFAGQGAQSVGMGRELAAHHPAAGELFQEADQILGRSLSAIAWKGPLEELTKTSNCQPALYVHGLACLAALQSAAGDFPVEAAAGLSLGEWTAHAAARTFDFATGLKLVETRGRRGQRTHQPAGVQLRHHRADDDDHRHAEPLLRARK